MSTSPPVSSGTPVNIGILLRRPFQSVVAEVDTALASSGHAVIRPAHGVVFQFIDSGGTTVAVLARRAQMTKQSMAELVTHLETHGYVKRVPDPSDRRAKLVRLTQKGWDVIPIALAAIDALTVRWRTQLGERRYQLLIESLEALNEVSPLE